MRFLARGLRFGHSFEFLLLCKSHCRTCKHQRRFLWISSLQNLMTHRATVRTKLLVLHLDLVIKPAGQPLNRPKDPLETPNDRSVWQTLTFPQYISLPMTTSLHVQKVTNKILISCWQGACSSWRFCQCQCHPTNRAQSDWLLVAKVSLELCWELVELLASPQRAHRRNRQMKRMKQKGLELRRLELLSFWVNSFQSALQDHPTFSCRLPVLDHPWSRC